MDENTMVISRECRMWDATLMGSTLDTEFCTIGMGLWIMKKIWKYDKPYQSETDDHLLDNHVDSIEIGNNMYDDLTEFIHPYSFDSCKRIVIGDYSLRNIRLFAVVGLSELESVSIGHNSLRLSSTPFSLYECRNNGGICRIENCPKLMSIRVKEYSFTNHGSFELTNLPSLESIEIGDYCFSHASELSLSCSCE